METNGQGTPELSPPTDSNTNDGDGTQVIPIVSGAANDDLPISIKPVSPSPLAADEPELIPVIDPPLALTGSRPTTASSRATTVNPAAIQTHVSLVLRPMAKSWQMGEDWEVSRPYSSTFVDLRVFIEEERGISRHRIQIRFRDKVVVPSREKWTLRRMGINSGTVLLIEPTMLGSWWWNSMDHYREELLSLVEQTVDDAGGGMFLCELEKKVQLPPPITVSLRVLLRTYPERLHLYCNTVENTLWVERANGLIDPPTFASVPRTLGHFQQYVPPETDLTLEDFNNLDEEDDGEDLVEEESKEQSQAARPIAPAEDQPYEGPITDATTESIPTAENEALDGAPGEPNAARADEPRAASVPAARLPAASVAANTAAVKDVDLNSLSPEELEHHIAMNAGMS